MFSRSCVPGKAVLCEKPLNLDQKLAEEAAAKIERLGSPFMLAFNRRFDPSASAIKQAIERGEIGDVRQVIITSRDDGRASNGWWQAMPYQHQSPGSIWS